MAAEPQRRFEILDIFRALAATLVMLHHAACVTHLDYMQRAQTLSLFSPGYNFVLQALSNGVFPVELFIAISGYSLTLAAMQRRQPVACLDFYRRRFWRIAPPYYLGVLVSALLGVTLLSRHTGSHWDGFVPFTGADLLHNFAFINNFFAEKQKINGAYWSIAAEMQMYLLFPFIFNALAGAKRGDVARLAAVALLVGVGALVWRDFPPNRNLYLFYFLGIVAATFRDSLRGAMQRSRGGRGVRTVLLAIMAAYFGLHAFGALHKSLIVDLLVAAAFMLFASLGRKPEPSRLAAGAAAVGLFSYSIYLIHEPLQQLAWQYGLRLLTDSGNLQLAGLILVSLLAIMPLSYLYFRLIEQPFISKRRSEARPAAE